MRRYYLGKTPDYLLRKIILLGYGGDYEGLLKRMEEEAKATTDLRKRLRLKKDIFFLKDLER